VSSQKKKKKKTGDRFLEQRINIKFCVKLGKNASDNFEVLCEAYGGEAMFLSGMNGSKKDRESVEYYERSGRPRSHKTDEISKKCEVWCILTVYRAYYVEILKLLGETVRKKQRTELLPND
jgi:hypothetical protein